MPAEPMQDWNRAMVDPRILHVLFASAGVPLAVGAAFAGDDTGNAARLDAMSRRALSLQLAFEEEQDRLNVNREPLFRYSAPNRSTTDGTLWAWTKAGRPIALACLFLDPREGFDWNYELVSLSDRAFVVSGRPGWSWKPQGVRRLWQALDGPRPAGSEAARLVQMKSITRSLQVSEDLDGDVVQLRLLPRPVLRYQASDEGVVDGTMFLFVYGTNPEVAVLVEATGDEKEPWRLAFARLGAAELTVRRNGQTLWQAERVREWLPTRPYFSQYGPDPVPEVVPEEEKNK
ncbi:MAG: hypothetical protein KY476_18665 [Planctomycetes bacterium]|nr:hypothetical protein [Planctomycetota bacterium]